MSFVLCLSAQRSFVIEAYALCDDDTDTGAQAFAKGCALIRANLHIDPTALSDDEWAMYFQQAVWLEGFRLKKQMEILTKILPSNGK